MSTKEEWKDVPGYEGIYQASNLGRIKRLSRIISAGRGDRLCKETIRKPVEHRTGYPMIVLFKNKKRKVFQVHQVIAMTFLGHKPCGHTMVVNHKDWNKNNNCVDNLEVVTSRKNASYRKVSGTSKYTGVNWDKEKRKWQAKIYINKKSKFLGYYNNEIDAHNIYTDFLNTHLPLQ